MTDPATEALDGTGGTAPPTADEALADVPRSRVRAVLWNGGRVAFGLAVLVIVVRQIDASALETLRRPRHIAWAVAALAFLASNVWVAAWRWQLLLHALGVDERLGPLLRAIYVAAFYNLVLPGQLGGQAIKVLLLGRRSPALAAIIASVAIDQIIVIAALVILAASSALVAPGVDHRAGWAAAFGALAVVASVLLAAAASARLQAWIRHRLGAARWLRWLPLSVRRGTDESWRSLAVYGRRPWLLGAAVGQAVLFLLTLAGMATALGRALDIELSPATMTFVLVLGLIAGVAPFTLAGLGTREPTFVAALGAFGIAQPVGAAFAVLWLLLNSLADLMGAAMQFWHPRQTGTLVAPVDT
ncbi:MAG TPA: lysylphosphatidylglycerol synthase transmembrane domain-containing protein [Candidatus Dormibacteraeota bacterium]|nr:lysylphosphatidylglycerol synthase transmembrane domain-containing protein [Candidatus Dormibacteraeota bacterium]